MGGRPKPKIFIAAAIAAISMALAGCSPFAGFVADHWPHWAGGMPDGVPPRQGTPGYDEFIAHGEGAKIAPGPGDAEARPAPQASPQPAPKAGSDAVKGGLY
jgi:hypothetical protein